MATIIGIELHELCDQINRCVSAAFAEHERKVNSTRLCDPKETRQLLGNVSHQWLGELQKSGWLLPHSGGKKRGSTRYYRYTDILAYINKKKK